MCGSWINILYTEYHSPSTCLLGTFILFHFPSRISWLSVHEPLSGGCLLSFLDDYESVVKKMLIKVCKKENWNRLRGSEEPNIFLVFPFPPKAQLGVAQRLEYLGWLETLVWRGLCCSWNPCLLTCPSVNSPNFSGIWILLLFWGEQTLRVFQSKPLPDSFQILKLSLYKPLAIMGCEQKFPLLISWLNQSHTWLISFITKAHLIFQVQPSLPETNYSII